MFALFLEFGARTRPKDLWSFLVSETGLKFLIWTQGEVRPGNRASPVNAGSFEETLKWLILPAGNACKIAYSTQN